VRNFKFILRNFEAAFT